MNENCSWYFPVIVNGHKQGENDALTDLFSGPTFHALVRESLQNSLDAHQKDNPAATKVEFVLRSLPSSKLKDVFDIREHVEACMEYCGETTETEGGKFSSMVKYLDSVEDGDVLILDIIDSNTNGMDYVYDEESNEESGNFDSFVRCSGKPNSGTGTGGSHGYGKTTYFNASKIRCLLVSSMTAEDKQCNFEGVSWLCSHKIGRDHYADWGFFDNNGGRPIQATAEDYASIIPEDFQRKEPGSTVSIIGVDIEPDSLGKVYEEIKRAVFRNFFIAIKEQKLVVEIDFGEGMKCTINDEEMPNMLPLVFPEEFDTAKYTIIDSCNPRPYLKAYENAILIADKDTPIEEAINNRKNKTFIKIKDHLGKIGDVTFYGYIHPGATDTILYMRKPLMVVHATRDRNTKGFYGLFVCDDEIGNDYLKQMENADHKKWEKEKFKKTKDQEKYERANAIEEEMNAFLRKCVQIMFPQNESEEEDVSFEEFMMPAISEPNSYDSTIGQLVSEAPQENTEPGAPVDVVLSDTKQPAASGGESKGVAYPVKDIMAQREDKGDYTAGRKGKKKKKKRKKKTLPPFGNGTFDDTTDGKPSRVKEAIPVGFRFISDEVDGVFTHTLKITSPCAAENVAVEITAVGETVDSHDGGNLHIKTTDHGVAKGNAITGLTLVEGAENVIVFTLSNNAEYSFSLKAIGEITKQTS